jgi:hypothetical protein
MMAQVDHLLIERGYMRPGDAVVLVAGQLIGRPSTTNRMKLHRIGEYGDGEYGNKVAFFIRQDTGSGGLRGQNPSRSRVLKL